MSAYVSVACSDPRHRSCFAPTPWTSHWDLSASHSNQAPPCTPGTPQHTLPLPPGTSAATICHLSRTTQRRGDTPGLMGPLCPMTHTHTSSQSFPTNWSTPVECRTCSSRQRWRMSSEISCYRRSMRFPGAVLTRFSL